jgi:cbb3-type cytochrome oxidase maturation protein
MSVVFILLGASLTIAIGFLIAFIWSVKSGQYDDDYTPSVRMLFDNKSTKDISGTDTPINQPNNQPTK